jgi:hypothetical protein
MEELQKLYNTLVEQDLISKPFEEFVVDFADAEYVDKVFNAVKQKDLYSFDKESFTEKYSSKKKRQDADTESELEVGLQVSPTDIDPNNEAFREESDSISSTFNIYKDTQLKIQELESKEDKSLEETTALTDLIIKNDSLRQDILDRGKKLTEDRFPKTTPASEKQETSTGTKIPKGNLAKILKSNTLRTIGTIGDIGTYLGQVIFGSLAPLINPKLAEAVNKMSTDERRMFTSSLLSPKFTGMASPTRGLSVSNVAIDPDTTGKLMESADELRAAVTEYDTNIVQDIFSPRVLTGASRLINEVVGAIPQIALAFVPGGFVALGGGAAAGKLKRLQDEGYDLNFATVANATATGIAEGVFEIVTRGLAKRGFEYFKNLYKAGGKDAVLVKLRDVGKEFAKGFKYEGASEVATEITEDVLDALILGESDSFENAFFRYMDVFLIGGFVGGPLSSVGPGLAKLSQSRAKTQLDNTVAESKYQDIIEPFNKEKGNMTVEIDQLPIVNSNYSKQFLEATVDGQLQRNEISKREAEQIKENFEVAQGIFNQIPTQNLNPEKQQQAANLLLEKLELENYVAGKDVNLVAKDINRINAIKKELEDIGLEGAPITSTEQAAEEVEVKDESVGLDTPRLNVAPLFATSIETVEDAINLRQQPEYKQQIQTINDVLGAYEVEGVIDEAIGGYKNDDGVEIVEVSNVVNLGSNVTRDQADQIASILGALAPETQESTIAADYVGETDATKNGAEHLLNVSDVQGTLEALKESGITDFTLNEQNNSLSLLNLDEVTETKEFLKKLGSLKRKLDAKGIQFEVTEARGINSRYITRGRRQEILSSLKESSIQQQLEGTSIYQKVEQALDRLGETVTETTVEETVEASPEQVQQLIETINDPAAGIQETIVVGREKGFSDIEIQKVLQGRGFKVRDIKEALLPDSLITIPAAFRNIPGGINVGQPIFDAVQRQLDEFISKEEPTNAEIRGKAIELLKANETFQAFNEIEQQELILGYDKSIGTQANRVVQQEINQIKKSISDFKKGIKNLKQAQNLVNRFIRKSLPNESAIKGFVSSINKVTSKDDLPAVAEKVMQQIEQQRERQKLSVIRKIKTLAAKKARLKKSTSNKIKAGDLAAAGKMFFQSINEMMRAVTGKNPINDFLDITETLTDQVAIDEALDLQDNNPDKLTTAQKRLLNRFYAYNLVGDIFSKPLEEVQEIYNELIEERSRSIAELAAKREAEKVLFDVMKSNFDAQASIDFPWLFKEDGTPFDENELEQNERNIYDSNVESGFVGRVKNFLNTLDLKSKGGIRLFKTLRGNLATLGTLSKILDRYGDAARGEGAAEGFFYRNIYDETNIADENKFRGIYNQKDKLNEIASSIEGVNSYNDILKLIGYNEKVFTIKGSRTTFTTDNLARIYAISKNEFQRKKLKNQGFTEKVMNQIEDALGSKAIEFIDKTVEYLSTDYFESINDVYSKFNNIDLPQIPNYFPTKTLSSKPADLKLLSNPDGPSFVSIFAERSPTAFRIRDEYKEDAKVDTSFGLTFTTTLENHIDEMEKYKAYAAQVKRLQAILKIPGMNELLSQVGMSQLYKQMINNSINPEYGPLGDVPQFDLLANKFMGYALSFKLVQIPKQATSFVNALENYRFLDRKGDRTLIESAIDNVMFAVDVARMIPRLPKEINEMKELSASFKDRYAKGLEGDLYGLESGGRMALTTQKKAQRRRNLFQTAAAFPTTFGDVLGITGYKAQYNRNIKRGMSKEEALKVFNDYNATQQSRRATDKVALQMTTSSILKTITMFLSSIYLMQNKSVVSTAGIMKNLAAGKRPRAKDTRALATNLFLANALFTFVSNFSKAFGDDEDIRELVKRTLLSPLNLLYGIPFIGAGVEGLTTYASGSGFKPTTVTNPYLEIGEQIGRQIKKEGLGFGIVKPLFEITIGARVDPVIGLYNYFKDLELDEEEVYDILGVSPYYRPAKDTPSKPVSQGGGSVPLSEDVQKGFDAIDDAMKAIEKPINDIFKDIEDAIFE